MSKRFMREGQYRRNTLAAALAMGLGLTGVAYGQATTGSVYGTAPVASGDERVRQPRPGWSVGPAESGAQRENVTCVVPLSAALAVTR